MSIVVFEDAVCEQLSPITTARLAATITCGSYRLVDWLEQLHVECFGLSRPYLQQIQQLDFPILRDLTTSTIAADSKPLILLNARCVPSVSSYFTLRELLQTPDSSTKVLWDRNNIAAIVHPPISLKQLQEQGQRSLDQLLARAREFPIDDRTLATFEMPHEVISKNMECISANLEERIRSQRYQQMQDGVFTQGKVDIGQFVLFETQSGPIIIEDGAKIGPYTLLRGPLYIGRKCKILEHAAIKDCVSLGHTTKIGGEVEASVVEPFSNKQHHGFLGHSYLGSWINLGAGTCNSDLKNTYGSVNMEYNFGKVSTGMQFLGCIMGDYAKSAINTGIFTGKVIGVCSMMYGFVTSNVPSFVNYARLFGQLATLPPDVMIATQQRMFARRQVEQRDCDQQLIQDMYRITQNERDRFGDAISF